MHIRIPKQPPKARKKSWRLLACLLIIIISIVVIYGWKQVPSTPLPAAAPQKTGFNKTRHSLTNPASLWVITNKKHPLTPATYVPKDLTVPNVPLRLSAKADEMRLRAEAASALEKLVNQAREQGVGFMLASAYRSYNFQKNLYAYYVQQQGQESADTQSARAGYSEHQTGLAADLEPLNRACEIEACFAETPEGKWLAAHAHEHGFIIRYPEGQEATTGYAYEPWHVRYVGTDLARQLHDHPGQTLEDFFGLGKAAGY